MHLIPNPPHNPSMSKFWIVVGGIPQQVKGEIVGDTATVPLPLGGYQAFVWPRWYASKDAALAALAAKREKRLERARRLIAGQP